MPVSKHAYILTRDNFAVQDNGTHSGVVLVGKGGTITDEVAAQYGIEVFSAEEHAAARQAQDDQRLADLNYARTHIAAPVATPSGQVTDKQALDSARQTNDAVREGTSPLTPSVPGSE